MKELAIKPNEEPFQMLSDSSPVSLLEFCFPFSEHIEICGLFIIIKYNSRHFEGAMQCMLTSLTIPPLSLLTTRPLYKSLSHVHV